MLHRGVQSVRVAQGDDDGALRGHGAESVSGNRSAVLSGPMAQDASQSLEVPALIEPEWDVGRFGKSASPLYRNPFNVFIFSKFQHSFNTHIPGTVSTETFQHTVSTHTFQIGN